MNPHIVGVYNLEKDMYDYNALEKMIEIIKTKKDK
jgi:hypothetical protein